MAEPNAKSAASASPTAPKVAASAACSLEAPATSNKLALTWDLIAAKGVAGWVADLSADEDGVFAAGADSSSRTGAQSFVASYDREGHERFRVSLDKTAISGLKPPRASAFSVAAAGHGAVYALTLAANAPALASLHLSLLEATGRERFSVPLELSTQVGARVIADTLGDAFVIGLAPSGELTLAKYASTGARAWLKRYPYQGDLPWLALAGDHLALAASLHGFAEFGAKRLSLLDTFRYHCEDTTRECEAEARALLIAELDGDGNAVQSALLGSASNSVSVSGFAALPDGRLVVTGEFSGPALAMGNVTLCELQPGMPARESAVFREGNNAAAHACDCRGDQRDLFVLELSRSGLPLWAKTLALGQAQPRIAASADGSIIWAAQTATDSAELAASAKSSALAWWQLDANGLVRQRQSAERALRLMTVAADGGAYISDGRNLQRILSNIVK